MLKVKVASCQRHLLHHQPSDIPQLPSASSSAAAAETGQWCDGMRRDCGARSVDGSNVIYDLDCLSQYHCKSTHKDVVWRHSSRSVCRLVGPGPTHTSLRGREKGEGNWKTWAVISLATDHVTGQLGPWLHWWGSMVTNSATLYCNKSVSVKALAWLRYHCCALCMHADGLPQALPLLDELEREVCKSFNF